MSVYLAMLHFPIHPNDGKFTWRWASSRTFVAATGRSNCEDEELEPGFCMSPRRSSPPPTKLNDHAAVPQNGSGGVVVWSLASSGLPITIGTYCLVSACNAQRHHGTGFAHLLIERPSAVRFLSNPPPTTHWRRVWIFGRFDRAWLLVPPGTSLTHSTLISSGSGQSTDKRYLCRKVELAMASKSHHRGLCIATSSSVDHPPIVAIVSSIGRRNHGHLKVVIRFSEISI